MVIRKEMSALGPTSCGPAAYFFLMTPVKSPFGSALSARTAKPSKRLRCPPSTAQRPLVRVSLRQNRERYPQSKSTGLHLVAPVDREPRPRLKTRDGTGGLKPPGHPSLVWPEP